MVYRVIAVDLDDTLVHESDPFVRVCRGATRCLQDMRKLGIPIVLVTHNGNPQRVIDHLGWNFDAVIVNAQDGSSKRTELREVCSMYGIEPHNLILFDDDPDNIASARDLGATGVLVDHESGITLADLEPLHKN